MSRWRNGRLCRSKPGCRKACGFESHPLRQGARPLCSHMTFFESHRDPWCRLSVCSAKRPVRGQSNSAVGAARRSSREEKAGTAQGFGTKKYPLCQVAQRDHSRRIAASVFGRLAKSAALIYGYSSVGRAAVSKTAYGGSSPPTHARSPGKSS